ncbi:CxxxxCH/CxxCH domain-containing protein, partial [bacterium]|nr:CxxxxCH/CxxCH domain-containing protein [bacterium]MBU1917130.1 CxxxxCH/CxxCH domain-containing protein [bacterium]
CHMTKTGTVVTSGDVGGHSFESIHPEKSLNFLKEGKDPIPNACASCHNEHTSQNVLAGDLDSEEYLNLLIESYKAKYEQAKPSGDIASYTHSDNFVTTHGDYYLKSKSSCLNSCHGDNLSGGTLENGTNVPSCWSCHYSYPHDKRLELDGIGDQPWQSSHAPYYADNDCKTCHGEDYTTVINDLSCASCHASPGDDFSQFTDATCANQLCHGTPPLTGTHASHYAGMYPENLEEPFYGDDNNYSTNTEYRFGCGTCHPINPSKHRNKVVDIELFNETANPHSLKALMENTAHYDAETKTCSNTYCHSQTEYVGAGGSAIKVPFPVSFTDPSGELKDLDELVAAFNGDNFKTISSYFLWNHFSAPENQKEAYYWSLPSLWSLDELCNAGSLQTLCQGGVDMNGVDVFAYDPQNFGYKISYPINYEINQVRRYHTTPAWNSGESLSCNSCHSYPPRSQLTDDEWDPSDPNWESSQPTILSEAAIDKHSFIFSKLTADGETIEVGHLANMKPYSKAPLRCQVCHIETVERLNLASWENGTGWHVGDKGIIELDPISIADKAYHVNGTVDVNFDQSLAVTSYEFNDEFFPYTLRAFPEPTTSSGMTINTAMNYLGKPAYYGVHSGETPGAQWHPETKTCSNVSCHLEQSFVQWTAPYRPHSEAECSRCHQFHSDPTTINPDNATMCWPHAPHNGCEHKIPLKKEFNNF